MNINWLLEKKPIIDEYRAIVINYSEGDIKLGGCFPEEDYVVYVGEYLPVHPVLENGIVREATDEELINKGLIKLGNNEILLQGKIVNIYNIPSNPNLVKPKFNYQTSVWEEGATVEEIANHRHNKLLEFYNDELKLAMMACTEATLGLVTPEQLLEVKEYMILINPYEAVQQLNIPPRPEVFNRYRVA